MGLSCWSLSSHDPKDSCCSEKLVDQQDIQHIKAETKTTVTKFQFKINFSYPSCCLSVSLSEQVFMVKAKTEQEEAKALWIIQEQCVIHDKCF